MWIINSDTNAAVGGFIIPQGAYELPYEGTVVVLTSGGCNTNFSAGSGDTLIVWTGGAALHQGVAPWQMFLLGLWIVMCLVGLLAIARRFAKALSWGAVKEV